MDTPRKTREVIRFVQTKTRTSVVSCDKQGNGHYRVTFQDEAGRCARVSLAATGSDQRGFHNTVADVRRALRQQGAAA